MSDGENINYVEISVKGKSDLLWEKLRPKLHEAVNKFLDTVVDSSRKTTIRDEAKELTSSLLKYAKAKLNKPELENQKILAEIDNLYSSKQKDIAEARKIHAEADAIEFQNALNNLRMSLMLTKALLISNKDTNSILFIKEIEGLTEVVNTIKALS